MAGAAIPALEVDYRHSVVYKTKLIISFSHVLKHAKISHVLEELNPNVSTAVLFVDQWMENQNEIVSNS